MNAIVPLRERARGRWPGILTAIGIDAGYLTRKNGPCPICQDGRDRWRFFDTNGDGTWNCRYCGGGLGIDLVMKFTGLPFKEAAQRIEMVIGAEPITIKAKPVADPRPKLRRMWRDAKPTMPDDVVDTYLRSRRVGLDVYPSTIRTAPGLRCYEDDTTNTFPAMLAVVRDITGKPVTIHRTYLAADGSGKAPVEKPRKIVSKHGTSPHILVSALDLRHRDIRAAGWPAAADCFCRPRRQRRWPESRTPAGRTARGPDPDRDQVSRHNGRRLERRTEAAMRTVVYLRRAEIIVIARRKHVADTADLDRFLVAWFWHRPKSADADPIGTLIHVAWRMGRANLTSAEAEEIISASKRGRPLYKADDLGEYLRLTDRERTAWGIRTIGGHDVSKRQRALRCKQKAKERQARFRQQRGATPHARSLSRTKPWETEGISRRTWERHRKQEQEQEAAE